MEVLHSAEEKGLATLPTFLEHWRAKSGEEKVPMPESMDAVRVMTIHKSKGLEAPVVIVPWTDLRARMDAAAVLVEHDGLRFAAGNKKSLGAPYYREMARQCRENLHLLYVAFTRARDALFVLRTSTVGGGRGSASAALEILMGDAGLDAPYAVGEERPAEETPMGAAAALTDEAPEQREQVSGSRTGQLSPQLGAQAGTQPGMQAGPQPAVAFAPEWRPMQWLPRLKIFRNPLAGFNFRGEDRGSFLHLCLEHLHITGNPREDALAALNFGLGHFSLPVPEEAALRDNAAAALQWFAAQPEAARWLRTGWPEHSIMDAEGRLLRVDLLVREPWGPLVLDYKSGQPEEAHAAQLRGYLACLEAGAARANDAPGAPLTPRGLLVYLDLRRFRLVDALSVSPLAERCGDLLPAVDAAEKCAPHAEQEKDA